MDGCRKDEGMNMLIRSMTPEVIAVDEIGSREDVDALFFVHIEAVPCLQLLMEKAEIPY